MNDPSNRIYFIIKGQVIILHSETGIIYKELEDDEYFGEIGFFSKSNRLAAAESISFVNITHLSYGEFFKLAVYEENKEFEVIIISNYFIVNI